MSGVPEALREGPQRARAALLAGGAGMKIIAVAGLGAIGLWLAGASYSLPAMKSDALPGGDPGGIAARGASPNL